MTQTSYAECQTKSDQKRFGLCDDPPPSNHPAYIDENNGSKWIAVVENDLRKDTIFTAIDNCIAIIRDDGKMEKRCDGALSYENTVIFIELKQRDVKGNRWVTEAIEQLETSIDFFEDNGWLEEFEVKKAYICNSKRPVFRSGQQERMNDFFLRTGYVLRIEARIRLEI